MNQPPPENPPRLRVAAPKRKGGLWWKLLLGAAGLIALLIVVLVLSANSILRGVARNRIEQATGMKTEIDSLKLSLRPPGVRLAGFRLINPEEFGGKLFLDLPELAVKVNRDRTAPDALHLSEFTVNLARVNVVVDESGRSNLDELQRRAKLNQLRSGKTNAPKPEVELAVDRLQISLGKLQLEDRRDPNASRTLAFNWTNATALSITNRQDLNARLLAMFILNGARLQGEDETITDPITLGSLIGMLLKPSGQ